MTAEKCVDLRITARSVTLYAEEEFLMNEKYARLAWVQYGIILGSVVLWGALFYSVLH